MGPQAREDSRARRVSRSEVCSLLSTIGLGGAYSIYSVFAAISGFCAWKFVRETKGRSPEEMEL